MKYYSDITNRLYETCEELEAAERSHKEKLVEKAKAEELRKAELEKAVTARNNAKAEYETALEACNEALANWSKADRALKDLQQKTSGTKDNSRSEEYVNILNLVETLSKQANKWFGMKY